MPYNERLNLTLPIRLYRPSKGTPPKQDPPEESRDRDETP